MKKWANKERYTFEERKSYAEKVMKENPGYVAVSKSKHFLRFFLVNPNNFF